MKLVTGVIILLIWQANGSPMEDFIDGYHYSEPPCPLVYPSTKTITVPQVQYVTEEFTKTETIVTVLKPSTITSTTIVPTTTTETRTATSTRTETDFRTFISTITETLPPVSTTSTATLTQWKTTSYPVTTTVTAAETNFRTETSTRFSTKTSTVTETQTSTVPVTTTLTTTVCTLNNAYLPARDNPTCVPPPQTYLPVDILPPFAPPSITALSSAECPETITSTIFRDAPTKTITILPSRSAVAARENGPTKYVMKDVVTVTRSLTRTSSVILFDQLVTKRVYVTPTLTSYIYFDAVTKTVPSRRSPTALVG